MAHEWKIGDWCDWGIERQYVWKLCAFPGGVRIHLINVAGSTAYTIIEDSRLKHLPECTGWDLPECTGWDWEPPKPIEPPEGYRLVTDGKVEEGDMYRVSNGFWFYCLSIGSSIRFGLSGGGATAYARKIEPKYRPFANAAELAPHRDKWVRWKENDSIAVHRIHSYSETVVWVGAAPTLFWKEAFECLEFEDGTPFGVKE